MDQSGHTGKWYIHTAVTPQDRLPKAVMQVSQYRSLQEVKDSKQSLAIYISMIILYTC